MFIKTKKCIIINVFGFIFICNKPLEWLDDCQLMQCAFLISPQLFHTSSILCGSKKETMHSASLYNCAKFVYLHSQFVCLFAVLFNSRNMVGTRMHGVYILYIIYIEYNTHDK